MKGALLVGVDGVYEVDIFAKQSKLFGKDCPRHLLGQRGPSSHRDRQSPPLERDPSPCVIDGIRLADSMVCTNQGGLT